MKDSWVEFRRLSDRPSAEELVSLLGTEGVPARVEAPQLIPGVEGYYLVYVSSGLLHRARWVAPQSQYTEAELNFFATGELSKDG